MLTQASAHRKDTNAPLSVELQHRHFAFIAGVLKSLDRPLRVLVVYQFADACAQTNPKFDRRRFLLACGVND